MQSKKSLLEYVYLKKKEEVNCACPLHLDIEVSMVHKGDELTFSAKSQYGLDIIVSRLREFEHEEK